MADGMEYVEVAAMVAKAQNEERAARQRHIADIMRDLMEYVEVAGMVAKAQNEERAARQRHIADIVRDLRAEFRRETMELREEVGELVAEVHNLIQREKELRDEGDAAVLRMANARTADRV